ncbi:TlpA disulfide reductase family protein [Kitasatospora sp. NPDC002040]|uniref:TlpA family protein disulfide reductase n=1 Tax=Kitasatospora sp. NPDC002040 TaxID=3154661 RepID=UPI003323B815
MSGTTRRYLRPAAALAAAAALTLTGCTADSSSSDGQTGFISGKGGLDTAPAASRQEAPAISGTTLRGDKQALADYRGKVVVLNVWGSWCNPCRAEAKGLQEVWTKLKTQGQDIQFLGINTRDPDANNAIRFEDSFGIDYPSLYDPDGTQILKFPKGSLNPQSIPSTIVVDRQGRLAARAMRPLSAEDLESLIAPVLAESK